MPKYKGLAIYSEHGARWTGESRLWIPDLAMPLRHKKPAKIFVADICVARRRCLFSTETFTMGSFIRNEYLGWLNFSPMFF